MRTRPVSTSTSTTHRWVPPDQPQPVICVPVNSSLPSRRSSTPSGSKPALIAAFIFIGVTAIGFWKHGLKFFKFFVPSGVPFVMLPLLVVIEVISYLTRPISLSVRLFANMMAGHTMLKVFGAFVVALGFFGGWAPLAFMGAFTGLEILVAFLQAYVFAILTCIYLNDALHMHH